VEFVGTFEGVSFVDEGDFEYDVAVEFTGVDEGTWSMVKASDPTTSIAGTLVQATTSTGESILDVQYVDNLTVTSSSGDAAGVSGKIQLFGTRTEISYPEGCLFAFTTHGLLLSALHRRLTR
jgi:hypothetical protein